MSWENTYINLAIAFDATLSDIPNDIDHLKEALLVMVDIINYDSTDIGTEAVVELLRDMDLLYRNAKSHYSYDGLRNNMVLKINNFTIKNFGDLTSFVNDLTWPDGCIPFYWAELSENGSIDISNWDICS